MKRMKQRNNKENNGGFNMIKTLRKQLKNEKGLTLIELLAVIVILAIIAAIAIPAIGNIIKNSKYSAAKADAINVLNAAQLYYLDNPEKTEAIDLDDLITEGSVYLENQGVFKEKSLSITADSPHKLTATVPFDGQRTVEFSGVTIDDINADNEKGSGKDNKTISSQ